ncbi:YybS family protein [bacterium]|nr:YybS family protein [bacterium]
MSVQVKQIKSLALGVLATVLLYSSGFLVVFTPLPIFYLSVVHGRALGRTVFWIALISVLAVYWLLFPVMEGNEGALPTYMMLLPGFGMLKYFDIMSIKVFGTLYFGYFCLFGLMLSEGVKRKWPVPKWVFLSVFVSLGISFGAAVVLNLVGAIDIVATLNSYIDLVMEEVVRLNQQAASKGMQSQYITANIDQIGSAVVKIIPAALLIFTLFTGVCNVLVGGRLTRSRQLVGQISDQMIKWKVPSWFIWALISTGAVFYVNHYVLNVSLLKYFSINGFIVLGGIYFLQGIAIIAFFLRRWKSVFLKISAYLLIVLFLQTAAVGIIILGVADYWVGFRDRQTKNKKKE